MNIAKFTAILVWFSQLLNAAVLAIKTLPLVDAADPVALLGNGQNVKSVIFHSALAAAFGILQGFFPRIQPKNENQY